MAHAKSREVSLAIKTTEELLKGLDDLRAAWKDDHSKLPKGLSCSEKQERSVYYGGSGISLRHDPWGMRHQGYWRRRTRDLGSGFRGRL